MTRRHVADVNNFEQVLECKLKELHRSLVAEHLRFTAASAPQSMVEYIATGLEVEAERQPAKATSEDKVEAAAPTSVAPSVVDPIFRMAWKITHNHVAHDMMVVL